MFKKLRIRFIATTMIMLTTIMLLSFGAIYIFAKKNNEGMQYSEMEKMINNFKGGPGSQDGEINNARTGEGIRVLYNIATSTIKYDNTYDIEEEDVFNIVNEVLAQKRDRGFIKVEEYNFAYIKKEPRQGIEPSSIQGLEVNTQDVLQIVLKDSTYFNKGMTELIIIFIVIGIASLGLLFLVSLILARKAIKPVEVAYNGQKQFIADASHELKTPLAVIKTNIDIINANEEDTIKNQKKWLNYVSFQADRMSNLVNNLLYLAKVDNNEKLGIESDFNLSDVIMNQVLSFEAIIYENNLELKCDIEENLNFKGDKEGINQLMGILVDNAIKHSYKDTEVVITLKKAKEKVIISVENKGEEIKEEDLEKIFERFYRVDEARDREKGGYGLGLSIAKSIVEKYNGKIKAESENNITIFTAELQNRI